MDEGTLRACLPLWPTIIFKSSASAPRRLPFSDELIVLVSLRRREPRALMCLSFGSRIPFCPLSRHLRSALHRLAGQRHFWFQLVPDCILFTEQPTTLRLA